MMEENIEYYYRKMQAAISIVEEDEGNAQALDAVTSNFMCVYEYIKMFLIAQKERYYGYFLMDMELQIDYYSADDAAVNMDTYPFSLYVNPLLLGKNTIKEMIFIICHEIEHIVLEHPVEAKKVNITGDPWKSVALNYAMDASINDRLTFEMGRLKHNLMSCPDDAVTSFFLSEEYSVRLNRLEDFLYYYDKIVTFETQVIAESDLLSEEKKTHEPAAKDADDKQDESATSYEEWLRDVMAGDKKTDCAAEPDEEAYDGFWDDADEQISKKVKKRKGKKKSNGAGGKRIVYIIVPGRNNRIVTAKNRPPSLSLHKWSGMDMPEEIRELLRQFIREVVDGIPDRNRSLFPEYQQEALRKVLEKPKIPWEVLLRKYIGTIPNGYRKTRTRLDRRQPERFDISGKIGKRAIKLVVAIDTPASMTSDVLEKIFTEIFSIVKNSEFELTIIECDAEVQKVYEAKTMSDVNLKVNGRGGTAFTPVIKYINQNKQFRHALLIYFTDGSGEERIPQPLIYRTLWVLTEEKESFSLAEPFGEVIEMNKSSG